jgi:hypothetical protein
VANILADFASDTRERRTMSGSFPKHHAAIDGEQLAGDEIVAHEIDVGRGYLKRFSPLS